MIITNTFITQNLAERLARQTAIHRRCILLLQASRSRR